MRPLSPLLTSSRSRQHIATAALCLPLALATGQFARADVIGFTADAAIWQADIEGSIRSEGTEIDLQNDLGLDDNDAASLRAALEHPIPALPNIALGITDLNFEGSAELSRNITFENTNFSFSEQVDADIDLSHIDVTAYYEILDTIVSIDLGLTARWFHGDLAVNSVSASASADFDAVLPLLYGRAQVDLPLTGLAIAAQAQGASFDGNGLTELSAEIQYELTFGLGFRAGYRSMSIDVDDVSDVFADIDISGGFLGLYFDI